MKILAAVLFGLVVVSAVIAFSLHLATGHHRNGYRRKYPSHRRAP